jgi:hypothetical protein
MRRLIPSFTLLLLLALTALPTLAQDAVETAPTYNGLGLLMVLVGLAAAAGVGVMMARREASAEDDDLV